VQLSEDAQGSGDANARGKRETRSQLLDSSKWRASTRMAGLGNDPVQVYRTGRDLHWVKFTFETGFELPSSWINLPDYGLNLNRNILDFMRWPHIDLGAQDLNDI
jgi:hypothetical protein